MRNAARAETCNVEYRLKFVLFKACLKICFLSRWTNGERRVGSRSRAVKRGAEQSKNRFAFCGTLLAARLFDFYVAFIDFVCQRVSQRRYSNKSAHADFQPNLLCVDFRNFQTGSQTKMFYQSKYCNECGERIEGETRKWLISNRFCDACAADAGSWLWIKNLFAAIVVGAVGVCSGFYLQPAAPPKNFTTTQNSATSSAQVAKNQTVPPSNQALPPDAPTAAQKPVQPAAAAPPLAVASAAQSENIYYCGAKTQKGTPCTRKIKGGGRCWQHVGKPAMLPQEKLLVAAEK